MKVGRLNRYVMYLLVFYSKFHMFWNSLNFAQIAKFYPSLNIWIGKSLNLSEVNPICKRVPVMCIGIYHTHNMTLIMKPHI